MANILYHSWPKILVLVLDFLSCIGIGIVKIIFEVLVLVLLRGFPKYCYWVYYIELLALFFSFIGIVLRLSKVLVLELGS